MGVSPDRNGLEDIHHATLFARHRFHPPSPFWTSGTQTSPSPVTGLGENTSYFSPKSLLTLHFIPLHTRIFNSE